MNVPLDYVKLIENTNNKFKVLYVNHSLSNDLSNDGHQVVKVYDFKSLMDNYLKTNLDYLTDVRIIEFTKMNTKISLDLRQKPQIELKLIKKDKNILGFTQFYTQLKCAYNDFLPIKQEKYDDIKKLLNYVNLPEGTTFYSDDYLKIKLKTNNKKNLANNEEFNYCKCKGQCIKKCFCKFNSNNCSDSCLCNFKKCKNQTK